MRTEKIKALAIRMIENRRACQCFGCWMLSLYQRPSHECFAGERRFDVQCMKVGAHSQREFVLVQDHVGWLMFSIKD